MINFKILIFKLNKYIYLQLKCWTINFYIPDIPDILLEYSFIEGMKCLSTRDRVNGPALLHSSKFEPEWTNPAGPGLADSEWWEFTLCLISKTWKIKITK